MASMGQRRQPEQKGFSDTPQAVGGEKRDPKSKIQGSATNRKGIGWNCVVIILLWA